MNPKTTLVIVALVAVAAVTITATAEQVFASGGQCGSCASSFTPKSLSSSLSGTGEHGVQKVFAPGQEALATDGSASSFSPGHEKP